MPKWNPINVCSYHLQEAGATPVQELAFALATAIAVLDTVKAVGRRSTDAGVRRGGRPHLVLRQRRHALRHRDVQDAGVRRAVGRDHPRALRRRRPEASAASATACRSTRSASPSSSRRTTSTASCIEMLAVTLSKNARARAVQLPAWNEALGLPRPWDQQWSLRMQQIMAYETDLLEYGDIFDGSPRSPRKVEALKAEAREPSSPRIDAMGGAIAAVETGYMKQQLVEANARAAGGDRGAASRSSSASTASPRPSPRRSPTGEGADPAPCREHVEAEQVERLKAWRDSRDAKAVAAALAELARGRAGRPQHHGALDRLRQGRRHHRRVGRRRCARSSASTARRPASAAPPAPTSPASTRCARDVELVSTTARPPPQVPGRQARPRRPFQRRRADRRARPRRRHGGGLRGHPPDPGRDRQRRAGGGRPRRRPVDPLRLARAAGARRDGAHARRGPRRHAGVVGGIIPPEDDGAAQGVRRRARSTRPRTSS